MHEKISRTDNDIFKFISCNKARISQMIGWYSILAIVDFNRKTFDTSF